MGEPVAIGVHQAQRWQLTPVFKQGSNVVVSTGLLLGSPEGTAANGWQMGAAGYALLRRGVRRCWEEMEEKKR